MKRYLVPSIIFGGLLMASSAYAALPQPLMNQDVFAKDAASYAASLNYAANTYSNTYVDAPVMVDTQTQMDAEMGVPYTTGGIGSAEVKAMEAVKGEYNTHLTFSTAHGAYVTGATLSVTDANGNDVILLESDAGPLFYAQLPEGTYTITANYGGEVKTRTLKVGNASANHDLVFTWNTNEE